MRWMLAIACLISMLALTIGQAGASSGGGDDGLGEIGGVPAPGIGGSAPGGNGCDTLDPAYTVVVQSDRAVKYQCDPNLDITSWSLSAVDRLVVTKRNDPDGMIYLPGGKSADITPGTDGIKDSYRAVWTVRGKIPTVVEDFVSPGTAVIKPGEIGGANFVMFFQVPRFQNANQPQADTTDCQSYIKKGQWMTGNDDFLAITYGIAVTPDQDLGSGNNSLLLRKEVGIAHYDSSALSLGAFPAKYNAETGQPIPSGIQTRCTTYPGPSGTWVYAKRTEDGTVTGIPKTYSDPGTIGLSHSVSGNTLTIDVPFLYHWFQGASNNGNTFEIGAPGWAVERVFPATQALVNVWDVAPIRCPGGPTVTCPTVNDPRGGGRPPLLKPNQELRAGTYLKLNPYVDWAPGGSFDLGSFSGTLTIGAEVVHNPAECPDYEGADVKSVDEKDADNYFQANPLYDSNLNDGAQGLLHFDSSGEGGFHVNGTETPALPLLFPGAPKSQDHLGPNGCSERIPTAQKNIGGAGFLI